MKALEFRLSSEFGMFRRPEKQRPALTFGIIPKSAVLGACGAIIGLDGYRISGSLPEFWDKLKHLRVAITPLQADGSPARIPFRKIFVKYLNYHGYGNMDGPDILQEQILIRPSFSLTLLGNDDDAQLSSIRRHLEGDSCTFRPYMGKNEFLANVEFIGEKKAEEFDGEIISCAGIYAENPKYLPGRATAKRVWSYLMRDDSSIGLDDYGRHMISKVCYHNGEIARAQADPNAGKFYKLDDGKIVFAF